MDISRHILIVEDDEMLRVSISGLMRDNGYGVNSVGTYNDAIMEMNEKYDLVLVDINLPDGNGVELCRHIRKQSNIPVIFLTANDDEESVVEGLEAGADDYIIKPFRRKELLSRIKAHLRRQTVEMLSQLYVSGDIIINDEMHEVTRNGEILELRPVEYELLTCFIMNPMIILKRDTLLEKLWDKDENFVDDSTLTVQISRLRGKLGLYQGDEYITTVRGYGYRWNLAVTTR